MGSGKTMQWENARKHLNKSTIKQIKKHSKVTGRYISNIESTLHARGEHALARKMLNELKSR